MMLTRRTLLGGMGSVAAVSSIGGQGMAQTYPVGPVRVVVGFPPGGATDITARLITRWLSDRFGAPFIVENRPGAGGNIGTASVANAAPDGQTLLLTITANAINATLYRNLPFNFLRDMVPVAGIARYPLVLTVHPSVHAKNVPEFLALAKADPGKLTMASGGNGSIMHMAGELFKMMAGVNLLHVPYRGAAPALNDLIAGHVHVMFDAIQSTIGHVRAGSLRALAVTSATRSEALPDVPTIGEFINGYAVDGWHGLGAPRGTPPAVVNRLAAELLTGLADSVVKRQLWEAGYVPMPKNADEFRMFVAEETEKWAKVVAFSGAKLD
jgi:Uncharacterized protein conserved in bacteria